MKILTQIELDEVVELHEKWLRGEEGGRRAELCNVDLRSVDLACVNLSFADLSHANLTSAKLRSTDLSYANLASANLASANLTSADLNHANLSSATGLKSNIDFLSEHFDKTEEGYIVYKTFGNHFAAPEGWKIAKGSILNENVNFNRTNGCGCGINVAPLDWVRSNYRGTIWKCLIRWEWLAGVCCPYRSDGKIRCERVELIEPVEEV